MNGHSHGHGHERLCMIGHSTVKDQLYITWTNYSNLDLFLKGWLLLYIAINHLNELFNSGNSSVMSFIDEKNIKATF